MEQTPEQSPEELSGESDAPHSILRIVLEFCTVLVIAVGLWIFASWLKSYIQSHEFDDPTGVGAVLDLFIVYGFAIVASLAPLVWGLALVVALYERWRERRLETKAAGPVQHVKRQSAGPITYQGRGRDPQA